MDEPEVPSLSKNFDIYATFDTPIASYHLTKSLQPQKPNLSAQLPQSQSLMQRRVYLERPQFSQKPQLNETILYAGQTLDDQQMRQQRSAQ